MKSHKDSVVVITGASRGIGLASATLFAQAGAKLALLARAPAPLTAAEQAMRALGADVVALPTDVTVEAAVQAAFAQIHDTFGRVDVLLNNAGTGFATDLATASLDDFRRIFETNVTGVFLCTRAVLPAMKARKAGHIINVSSIVGKVANPHAPLYCASKHALNGYNAGLRQQVAADHIRVSLVSPSAVDTAYWDGRAVDRSKFLTPTEVADVIFFVASQPEGVVITDVDFTALR